MKYDTLSKDVSKRQGMKSNHQPCGHDQQENDASMLRI